MKIRGSKITWGVQYSIFVVTIIRIIITIYTSLWITVIIQSFVPIVLFTFFLFPYSGYPSKGVGFPSSSRRGKQRGTSFIKYFALIRSQMLLTAQSECICLFSRQTQIELNKLDWDHAVYNGRFGVTKNIPKGMLPRGRVIVEFVSILNC